MRRFRWLVLLAPLAAASCISYSSSPPAKTTIVTPPGSTVTCPNGVEPPCTQ